MTDHHDDVDDCDCAFDDHPDDPGGDTWQYKRTCERCGRDWWSNHCRHDGCQTPCTECGWQQEGTRTPLEILGLLDGLGDEVPPDTAHWRHAAPFQVDGAAIGDDPTVIPLGVLADGTEAGIAITSGGVVSITWDETGRCWILHGLKETE